MAGEPSALYTLGVRLKLDSRPIMDAEKRLASFSGLAKRAERAMSALDAAIKRTSAASVTNLARIDAGLAGVRSGSVEAGKAAASIAVGYRIARNEAERLQRVTSKIPAARSPRSTRAPGSKNRADNRGAFDDQGMSAYFFGGGGLATIGGMAGAMAGGPIGAALGTIVGGAGDQGIGTLSTMMRVAAQLGIQAESTRASLAGLYQSIGGADFQSATRMASRTYEQLRMDAATGVGGLSDYTRAYGTLYTPLMQGGASLDQIRSLTKLSIGQGFALRGREGMELAPLDIVQALTSGLSERQTPFAMAALRGAGATRDEFEKAKIQDKIAILVRGFESFGPAVERVGQTFEAQADTLAELGRNFVREATGPLFESFRRGLTTLNRTLGDQAAVGTFTNSLTVMSTALGRAAESIAAAGSYVLAGVLRTGPDWQYAGQGVGRLTEQLGMTGGANSGWSGIGEAASRSWAGTAEALSRGSAATIYGARAWLATHTPAGLIPGVMPSDLVRDGRADVLSPLERIFRRDPLIQGPSEPDAATRAQNELAAAMDELAKKIAGDRTVRLELPPLRFEWGNDLQAAVGVTALLRSALDQVLNAPIEAT